MQKLRKFTVMGNGDFPFDMLRYDQCWPVKPEDAAELVCGETLEEHKRIRTITLATYTQHAPTCGRWSSFLWGAKLIEGGM